MKLRIKGNSIRLRLGRSEVSKMVTTGFVEESTTFDPDGLQRLTYLLVSSPEASEVSATFDACKIVVRIPAKLAHDWGTTDREGIEASQLTQGGARLRILIEKDLECIDAPIEESQDDAYPRQTHGAACPSTAIVDPLHASEVSP